MQQLILHAKTAAMSNYPDSRIGMHWQDASNILLQIYYANQNPKVEIPWDVKEERIDYSKENVHTIEVLSKKDE